VGHALNPVGALTAQGQFLRLHQYPHIHLRGGGSDAPLLSHIAYADNNLISVVLKANHDHHSTNVLEFISDVDFISWYDECSSHTSKNNPKPNQFTIPGRATHLVAGATSFALLNDSGEVFTWGDPRYPKSLARVLSAETPAEKPCLVDFLAGIPIAKVDAQGWLFGALACAKDLYLWGSTGPGASPRIPDLLDLGDDVKLVDHEAAEYVHDFGIGSRSVMMIVSEGVYGIGDNRSGQLGAGMEKDWVMEWTKADVPNSGPFFALHCGPETSFVSAQRE
jgi:hypothetical protein